MLEQASALTAREPDRSATLGGTVRKPRPPFRARPALPARSSMRGFWWRKLADANPATRSSTATRPFPPTPSGANFGLRRTASGRRAGVAHPRPARILGAFLPHNAGHARPKAETELLVETVLGHVKAQGLSASAAAHPGPRTGSGCILAALLIRAAPGAGHRRSTARRRHSRLRGIICRAWGCWIAHPSYVQIG